MVSTRTQTSGQGDAEPTEESALAAMQIDKMSARQLLHQSLPVPNDVLSVHQRALANVGQKARQNRQQVLIAASILSPEFWLLAKSPVQIYVAGARRHQCRCVFHVLAQTTICAL